MSFLERICGVTRGLPVVVPSEEKLKLVYCIVVHRCVLNTRRVKQVSHVSLKNSILEFFIYLLEFRLFKAPIHQNEISLRVTQLITLVQVQHLS